jgi:hypothetical protein
MNDGSVLSFQLEFAGSPGEEAGNRTIIVLQVRRHVIKQRFEECTVTLEFNRTSEVVISEDFRTNGGYSDIVLTKLANGQFYLSVDPYGNTGEPSEMDNFVIKAEKLVLVDKDVRHVVS